MILDDLHLRLVEGRDGVADLYRILESAVVLLEKSLQDREELVAQLTDLHTIIDAVCLERDQARAELEALRG